MNIHFIDRYKPYGKNRRRFFLVILVAILAAVFPLLPQGANSRANQNTAANRREDAYRANNLGVALLEQFTAKPAAEKFRKALEIDPQLSIARLNLSIALFYAAEVDEALIEAKKAAEVLPNSPQPFYILGLIAKTQNRTEDAIVAFRRVLQIDARDVGANVYLAQFLMLQRKYDEALKLLRVALEVEPYNATATYNLTISLLRSGQNEEGQRQMKRFQYLRDNYGTSLGQNYLEQGQYAEAIASTGAEPGLVDTTAPDVTFADATTGVLPANKKPETTGASTTQSLSVANLSEATKPAVLAHFSSEATLFDYDGDGDLDLFEISFSAQRLYRNDNGKFSDVTSAAGLAKADAKPMSLRAVAGDYDNDSKADLFVLGYGVCSLYHNDGGGKFSDVTAKAEIPTYPYLAQSVALADVDHDGDLDILIAGFADLTKLKSADKANQSLLIPDDFAGAPNLLLRNNGNGKFTDISKDAKVADASSQAIAIVPTDFNNRRDIDLLVVNRNATPALLSNLRDYTFRDVAADVGLKIEGRVTCVAAGDFNKDSFTDFFFGKLNGVGVFAVSDGKSRFQMMPAPAGSEAANAAQFADYDNDGLLDLVTFSAAGLRVFRNLGNSWADVSSRAVTGGSPLSIATDFSRAVASGDIDSDGDTDFIVRATSGELKFARNDGGNRNPSLRIQLAGKVSNRSGVGCKLEVRAGSLSQKLEAYAASPSPAPADFLFGLGKRATVDAARVLWPSGNLQAEVNLAPLATPRTPEARKNAPLAQSIKVEEVDRKPSSCPYLYTWNGERFEFITDFMGGGEMGYLMSPGVRNKPDPDEYVRIPEGKLKPRNGRYELRITNELEEVLYVDRLQLVAVAHPAEIEVYPNEGLLDPPLPPFKLYKTRNARPPVSATDDKGNNVLDRIANLDRSYPDDFKLHAIRGYAEEHSLTLDLGKPADGQTVLLMTAWTDYAFSSDNLAASQSGLSLIPPAVQVKNPQGVWQTIIADMGIPVGRPQTVAVDLTGRFLGPSREVRIVTNMRIYWDQILVDTSSGNFPAQLTRLNPLIADLHWRGFSAEITPDGRQPYVYDYEKVSALSPWKTFAGRYTREGDVRELVSKTDDIFVISMPGDELVLSFDASRLPKLPKAWKRTFLLYADGYSKEMDINSASPYQVEPLPFHGMSGYPYAASERYPMTDARKAYFKRYNTRLIRSQVSRLDAALAQELQTANRNTGNSSRKGNR